jgi:hypothetical protein
MNDQEQYLITKFSQCLSDLEKNQCSFALLEFFIFY